MRESRPPRKSRKSNTYEVNVLKKDDQMRPKNASSVPGSRSSKSRQQSRNGLEQKTQKSDSLLSHGRDERELNKLDSYDSPLQSKDCCELHDENHDNLQ